MDAASAELVVHRPRGYVGVARRFEVRVDGRPIGQLSNGGRLTVRVEPGRHVVDARLGVDDVSNRLEIEVAAGSSTAVAVNLRDPRQEDPVGDAGRWRRESLRVSVGEEGSVRPIPMSAFRTSVSRRRSPVEQAVYAAALVTTLVGLFVLRPLDEIAGTVVMGVGAVTLVVLFFRGMVFRKDRD